MNWICRPSDFLRPSLAMFVAGFVLLTVAGCASTGQSSNRVVDSGYGVPDYVRNLPKSRTGNMDEYTVFGKRYRVMDSAANFSEEGIASWYGKKFHGRKTSSGEIYDMHQMTAAHKHLPLPTYARVTNLENNRSVIVKVNDRGPFIGDRIIDMSYVAAQELGMAEQGIARVRVDALSTHYIAENENASALSVAKSFGSQSAPVAATAPIVAPPVIDAQVTAVPLPKPLARIDTNIADLQVAQAVPRRAEQKVAEMDLSDLNVKPNMAVDSSEDGFSEDGFVELTPQKTAALAGNYYIQLGAFSEPPNANALVADVVEQTGLPAYIEKDASGGLYRVKMGPFKQGDVLDNALTTLENIGIDGYTKLAASR